MRLGFDMDGCLAQFNTGFAEKLIAVTGKNLLPPDYDRTDPPVWEWPRHFGYTKAEEDATWQQVWDSKYFWHDLDVITGEQQSLTRIHHLNFVQGHEIYFITHRKGQRVQWQTGEWLRNMGVSCAPVLIAQSRNKLPLIQALQLDAYIDDNIDTANDLAITADMRQIPTRIYLRHTRHNQEARHAGLRVVPSVWGMLEQEGLS